MKRNRKKLYVWTDHATDYTSGLAFAIATSEEHARKMIIKAKSGYNPSQWGDLKVYPLTKSVAFSVGGGG